jgi:hypothetical protein
VIAKKTVKFVTDTPSTFTSSCAKVRTVGSDSRSRVGARSSVLVAVIRTPGSVWFVGVRVEPRGSSRLHVNRCCSTVHG